MIDSNWKAANKGHAAVAIELGNGVKRKRAKLKRKEHVDEVGIFTQKLLEEDR